MDDLQAQVEHWVAAGAIGREQADAIIALEAGRAGGRPGGRRTAAAEALGYVGGALALVAGVAIGAGQFARLGQGGRVSLLFAVTAALFAAGWWLRAGRNDTLRRLGSVLWFLSAGSWAGMVHTWSDGWGGYRLDDQLATAAGTLVYAAVLWLLERRSLQQVALFLPAAATGALIGEEVTGGGRPAELTAGAVLLALGAAWLELGRRGLVRPRRTAEALGALALVAGAESLRAGTGGWALLLGVATGLGLVVAGSALQRPVLLGIGAAALLLFLSEIAGAYWTSLGGPLAILLVGLGLVAAAVIVPRLQPRKGRSTRIRSPRPTH